MKTVLHMIETAGPGGAESVFVDLITSLDKSRWRSIAVIPETGWLHAQLSAAGVETHVLRERRTFDAGYAARLVSLVRRGKVDIIHSHLFGSAVRGSVISAMSGRPAVATLHGQTDLSENESYRSIKLAALKRLKRIVFVSEQLRDDILGMTTIDAGKVRVIPNGIEADRFGDVDRAEARASLGIAPDDFLVGTVGNPGPAKGFDVLIETASLLHSRSEGFRFIVAGDTSNGRGADIIALRDERKLEDIVSFIGFRSDVENVMGALDLFLLPSRSEGFSLALVEAMAAGLPVVATRCGGPEGIIDDGVTGVLVENGSPGAIADAVEMLRGDAARRRSMGDAARVIVAERYTRTAQTKAYEALYTECLTS